jgi:hypothetical protein
VKVSLLRALRIVIAADSDPVRQVLFKNLMQARTSVRAAYRLHQRLAGTWLSALLVSGYALAYFVRISPPRVRRTAILTVAKHANARRQIDRVCGWVGREQCDPVGTRLHVRAAAGALATLLSFEVAGALPRSFRIVRRLDRRYGFLVACRAAAAIAWYGRTAAVLRAGLPGAVLVSSDSNPEELGFTAAAAARGVPRIFVSHAYPTPFAPALDFELSILEGEAAVRARRRRGAIHGQILLAGVEGESQPLDVARLERQEPVIGIFTPKAITWPRLTAIIDECHEVFRPSRIVIRWHPSRLDQARHLHASRDGSGVEESPTSASLADVARRCDWVIADENSNVHLPVLKMGIPTVVMKGLGLYPESRSDMYGFAAAGIVFPPVRSLREIQIPAFKAFFDAAWIERFRQYDASYLRPEAEIRCEARSVIQRLIDAPPQESRPA